MTVNREVRVPILLREHLAGQHDQKTHAGGRAGARSIEEKLRTGAITDVEFHGGGIDLTYSGRIDGTKVFLRTDWQGERPIRNELAAQYVNDAMGGYVDMPRGVLRDPGDIEFSGIRSDPQNGINGMPSFRARQAYVQEYVEDAQPGYMTPGVARPGMDRLDVFDSIIGNTDRHGGNYLVRKDGRVVAIDHSQAFPPGRAEQWVGTTHRLTPADRKAVQRLLDTETPESLMKATGIGYQEATGTFERARAVLANDQSATPERLPVITIDGVAMSPGGWVDAGPIGQPGRPTSGGWENLPILGEATIREHLAGQHDQKSHGRKGSLGAPTGLDDFSPEARSAMLARAADLGLPSVEAMAARLGSMYDEASPGIRAEGERWYEEAHGLANQLAAEHGLSLETATAVIARTSPTREWMNNMEIAGDIVRISKRDEPFNIDAATYDALRTKPGRGPGMYRPSELSPDALAFAHPEFRVRDDGRRYGGLDHFRQVAEGVKLVRGLTTPDAALTGPKVRSFYNNILDPSDKRSVTVDNWMYRAAIGDRTPVKGGPGATGTRMVPAGAWDYGKLGQHLQGGPTAAKHGLPKGVGLYPLAAEAISRAASKRGVSPQQMQAVVWRQAQVSAGTVGGFIEEIGGVRSKRSAGFDELLAAAVPPKRKLLAPYRYDDDGDIADFEVVDERLGEAIEERFNPGQARDFRGRWTSTGSGQMSLGLKGNGDMATSAISNLKALGGGISATLTGTLEDGTKVVLKPASGLVDQSVRNGIEAGADLNNEIAAGIVNDAMGGYVKMPRSVIRTDLEFDGKKKRELEQDDLDNHYQFGDPLPEPTTGGSLVYEKYSVHKGEQVLVTEWADGATGMKRDEAFMRLAVYDSVIGNVDRHGGNLVRVPDPDDLTTYDAERIVAIDHSLSFPSVEGQYSYGMFNMQFNRNARSLRQEDYAALDRLMSSEVTVRAKLEPLIGKEATDLTFARAEYMRQNGSTITFGQMDDGSWSEMVDYTPGGS